MRLRYIRLVVENQLDKKIKILRLDRGGEHESHDFAKFCATHGIIHLMFIRIGFNEKPIWSYVCS